MAALLGVLRALAVLVGLWSVLAAVAFVAGVMPPIRPVWSSQGASSPATVADPPGPGAAEADGPTLAGEDPESSGEAGGTIPAGGHPVIGPAPDGAGREGAEPPVTLLGDARTATTGVCEADVADPSLAVVDIVGDPRPELAVGCGDRLLVLALRGDPPRPFRVASFEAGAAEAGVQASHTARVVVGDVSGDGLPDLVVPIWRAGPRGDVRGGGLYVVARDATGGFGAVRELVDAPVTVVRNVVERAGAQTYLAALHRASTVARRRSEVLVFRGGAAPERTAALRTGVGAVALAVLDLDGDQRRDLAVLAADDSQLEVFGGTGEGKFERRFTTPVRDGRELLDVDVDGDRRDDLVVVTAEGFSVLLPPDPDQGRATAALRVLETPGSGTVPMLDDVLAVDVDGDGRDDLLGVSEDRRLLAVAPGAPYALGAPRPLLPDGWLPSDARIASFIVGDLAIDGRADLGLVFRRGPDAPWELVMVADVRDGGGSPPAEEPDRLEDAPLTLHVPLVPRP